jgi:lipopolysaccharide heptosyltransferase I
MERLLIVRLGAMGDILSALPAAGALRAAFPTAHIGWAVEERWAELLCAPDCDPAGPRGPSKPLADTLHLSDTIGWRSALFSDETWAEMRAFRRGLRAQHYDVVVDLQGAVKSSLIAQLSGAPVRVGADDSYEFAAALLYTRRIATPATHVIDQALEIAAALGAGAAPDSATLLPCSATDERWAENVLRERSLGRFAILNPGAGWGAKQWPAERFGEVARALAHDGVRSLVNFGPTELELAQTVTAASDGAAVAVPCSVSELIALTRRAALFIGGDTGPLHLAAALHVPVVGIYGPTDPARNGPYGTRSLVLRSARSRRSHKRHAEPEAGLLEITAEEVIAAARTLLGGVA